MTATVGVQHAEGGAALEPLRHLAFAATTLGPLALLAVAVLAVQALVPLGAFLGVLGVYYSLK